MTVNDHTTKSFSQSPTDAASTNPKDLQGAKKCDVSLLPAIATYHAAHAMVDGATKYGPYNWREKNVLARVYIAGIKRHVERWEAGEELATDSGVHNLGGVMACAALLLDAQTTGNLVDNRAKSPAVLAAMDKIDAACKLRCERDAKQAPAVGPTSEETKTELGKPDKCGFAVNRSRHHIYMCSCGANVRGGEDRPDLCRNAKPDPRQPVLCDLDCTCPKCVAKQEKPSPLCAFEQKHPPAGTNYACAKCYCSVGDGLRPGGCKNWIEEKRKPPHGGVMQCTRPAPHVCGEIGSCNGWARI